MKQVKRILSFILIIALLVSLVPAGKDNVKEAEASDYQTIPDVILSDANENYPTEAGMKLFFPDITNVPASVYASGTDEAAKENGKLLAVYYKNTVHARGFSTSSCTCATGTPCSSDPYGEIHLVESTDNGETWSTPRKIVDAELLWKAGVGTEQVPVEGRDPNIAYLSDGTVILTFFTNHIAYDGTQNHTYILESHDGGTTWSTEPVKIDYCGQLRNGSKRGDIADFGDGYVLFPLQGHKANDSVDYASAAYGKHTYNEETDTWEWSFERCTDVTDSVTEGSEINESSFVVTGGDEVYALVRANGGVYHSTDRGATWTKIDTEEFQITDKDGNPAILNQPGLKLYTVEGEQYISVTYAVPNTVYGRPVYQKSVKLSDLDPSAINNTGWNNTKAELIYRCPNNTTEAADPSSVITNDGRILVVYYDGLMEYIGGTYIEELGSKTYTELTLGDFGVATSRTFGAFDANRTPLKTSNSTASLSGIAISGTYNFKSTTSMMIGNVWSGISVGYYQDGNGEQIYFTIGGEAIRIYSKDIGGRALLGRDISMRMTFDYLEQDSDGVDFIMGVTFDGYTTHMKFENVAEGNLKQVLLVGNATVTNPSYASLDKVGLFDFGITSLEINQRDTFKIGDGSGTLDGKSLTGIYNFSNTGSTIVTFGNYNSDKPGLELSFSGETLMVWFFDNSWVYRGTGISYITPSQVDSSYSSLKGRDLKIEMIFDLVEQADGTTDLTYTIIIDDKFSKTATIEEVVPALLKEAITIRNTGESNAKIADVDYYNAEVLTPSDFGVETIKELRGQTDGKRKIETDSPTETLNNKIITGIYNFSNGGSIVYGSSQWGGSVRLTAYNYGQHYFAAPEIWNGAGFVKGTPTADTSTVSGSIYAAYQLGGKEIVDSDLKIKTYFRFKDNGTNDTKDLTVIFWIEDVYRFTYTWDSVNTSTLVETISTNPDTNGAVLVMEPSVYPDGLLPIASGATLATNKDILRIKFDFSGVLTKITAKGETIQSYGGLVVAGTKDAATMEAKAETMISGEVLESDGYKRTEKSGDAITRLLETEDPAYYITITNSGTLENMAKRATAIGYIKTDQGIYYTTDCENADKQLVNRSVYGVLKKIFEENYVADYDAATVKEDTILYKAVAKYTAKDGTVQKTAEEVVAIVKSSDKSTEDTRKLLSGVHYTIPELWDGANAALRGKTLSILGASTDTYEGVSDDTSKNATLGINAFTYGPSVTGTCAGLELNETWWMRIINSKGMQLLVNNSCSGSAVSADANCGKNSALVEKASVDRCVQLHSEDQKPDIIAVANVVGNDFRKAQGTREFNDGVWNSICTANPDGTYTYVPGGGYFTDHYAITLHKIFIEYPEAEVFAFNFFEANDTMTNTFYHLYDSFNANIKQVVDYFDAQGFNVTLVDMYNESGLNRDNMDVYAYADGIHFNALGMAKMANVFEMALLEKFAQ